MRKRVYYMPKTFPGEETNPTTWDAYWKCKGPIAWITKKFSPQNLEWRNDNFPCILGICAISRLRCTICRLPSHNRFIQKAFQWYCYGSGQVINTGVHGPAPIGCRCLIGPAFQSSGECSLGDTWQQTKPSFSCRACEVTGLVSCGEAHYHNYIIMMSLMCPCGIYNYVIVGFCELLLE